MKRYFSIIAISFLLLTGCAEKALSVRHDVAFSADSERIAYTVSGEGETALIFIHGWSCDSRYWQKQIPAFASSYQVVTIDLAGHGHSSSDRADYTMALFGADVKAVMDKEGIQHAILIGHSMGGAVIVEAARLMPGRVLGIIGIDTFHNVGERIPQAVFDEMVAPFEADFRKAVHGFVSPMFPGDADPDLVNWVKEDMASAQRDAAISSFRNYLGRYLTGESAVAFLDLHLPVVSVNARLCPTNEEENRKHIHNYKPLYVEYAGHFPMLAEPAAFNAVLKQAIGHIEAQP